MLYIRKKPYGFLLIAAMMCMLAFAGLPFSGVDLQEIRLFRLPLTVISWLIPAFLIAFWFLYYLTRKFLFSDKVTWTHILITVSTLTMIMILLFTGIAFFQPASDNHYDSSAILRQKLIGNSMQVLFITFVCGQCAYLANVALGIFTRRK